MARHLARSTGVRRVRCQRLAGRGTRARHDRFCLLVSSSAGLDGQRHLAWHWSRNLGRSVAWRRGFLPGSLVDPPLVAAGPLCLNRLDVFPEFPSSSKSTLAQLHQPPTESPHENSGVPHPCGVSGCVRKRCALRRFLASESSPEKSTPCAPLRQAPHGVSVILTMKIVRPHGGGRALFENRICKRGPRTIGTRPKRCGRFALAYVAAAFMAGSLRRLAAFVRVHEA